MFLIKPVLRLKIQYDYIVGKISSSGHPTDSYQVLYNIQKCQIDLFCYSNIVINLPS